MDKQREIKFRGLTVGLKWEYGYMCIPEYGKYAGMSFILNKAGHLAYDVRPETLGQFTGLLDKQGKEIYEGDIVIGFCTSNHPAIIEWDAPNGGYNIREQDGEYQDIDSNTRMEVIGNIYENPELLWKKNE